MCWCKPIQGKMELNRVVEGCQIGKYIGLHTGPRWIRLEMDLR